MYIASLQLGQYCSFHLEDLGNNTFGTDTSSDIETDEKGLQIVMKTPERQASLKLQSTVTRNYIWHTI